METVEDEDSLTLGTSEVAAPFTADNTEEWRRRDLTLLSCDPLTPEPMKDAAVSAAVGPVVELPQSSRSRTCFQENEWFRSVDSPLELCELLWPNTDYKTFGTTA